MTGTFVGGFYLSQLLYSTDISDVYESSHPEKCTKLAVKLVKKGKADLTQVRNEFNINRAISCDYIMPVFYVIENVPENYYCAFVMKLAVGGDVHSFLKNNSPIGEKIAAQIMHSCLMAILYLHENGICHRDVKLENILIMDDNISQPDIVLSDFGHATFFKRFEKMNDYNIGTDLYNAPEIHLMKPYDETVDIWSLGVVMYILLSGDYPFPKDDPDLLRNAILNGQYNFDSIRWNSISQPAKQLIQNMIQVNPSDRISVEDALIHTWFEDNYVEYDRQSERRQNDQNLINSPTEFCEFRNSMEDDYLPYLI